MTNPIDYPYAVVSDVHFHSWSFGSYENTDGVNSRLASTISAFKEAAEKLKEHGGKDIVITGDLFHTRGEIKPSVYNPVYDMFKELSEQGFRIHAIPGNHDLETEETTEHGNCFRSFASIPNFNIYYETTGVTIKNDEEDIERFIFIPWTEKFNEKLMGIGNAITRVAEFRDKLPSYTIFAHVGVIGVLNGVNGTVSASQFTSVKGLKHAFCGHFHNYKPISVSDADADFTVYSVGALTHQSFKDVGSIAGFLIVKEDEVLHYDTNAPQFVDYGQKDFEDAKFDTDKFSGNFVRMNVPPTFSKFTREEITAIKVSLEALGAAKVVNLMVPSDTIAGVMDTSENPTAFVFDTRSKKVSVEFEKYVQARYDDAMSKSMLALFEKENIDED